ncbi:family 10 glycosylhydrolase [Allomuricauda sp. SCSIO 65647]|uniref:family 10 glycosylhydrolase n=1 Tax=Allomuricauda sp. SCSIO 65647 TaxID=2908843 RepID=UPI001F275CCE|nr:family 10 glycosylhydrolase [Muricauda sp. SCSIO 65647]UJH66788.1 family 10 glycosylhydrolase [Muricauda sp. SCSIO 65647]
MNPSTKFFFQYILLYTALCPVLFMSCGQKSVETTEIRGIYGDPKPFWDKELNLRDLGVNAIFVHSGSIDHDMVNRTRSEGLKLFAEFATLNGKNYVETHPEAWAIDEKGEKVEAASWFMGVCPTEPGFRQYRFDQLRDLLLTYDLDGVWMDYVHWHAQFEEPEPILPETCFCDHCLNAFSKDSGVEIPDGTTPEKASWILDNHDTIWRDWRCKVIYDWTYEVKRIIKEIKPEALLGLYHCPWNDQEFNNARYRILGLDYDLLTETIDVFSPMVYHERMGRAPDWVEENILWFGKRLNTEKGSYPKIWPIVQAYNNPGIVTSEEFEIVLKGGLAGKSTGVMMFTTYAVAEDEGKTETMKKVYTGLMQKASN